MTENSTTDANAIISQSVAAGSKVSSEDTVILYIPNIVVKYPDFTSGYTIDQIKEFCTKNGINLVIKPDGATTGKVISQSRKEGTAVASGATLTITLQVDNTTTSDCTGEFCDTAD